MEVLQKADRLREGAAEVLGAAPAVGALFQERCPAQRVTMVEYVAINTTCVPEATNNLMPHSAQLHEAFVYRACHWSHGRLAAADSVSCTRYQLCSDVGLECYWHVHN